MTANSTSRLKGYYLKFAILILAGLIGEAAIWWTMVREDSVDWISGQIVHQASHYAVSQRDDGETIVDNAIKGHEITLPAGFKVREAKNPIFYFAQGDKTVCEIKSSIINYKKEVDVNILKKEDKDLKNTFAGTVPALSKELTVSEAEITKDIIIPHKYYIIKYSLSTNKENKETCLKYFDKIKDSFIIY